MSEPRRGVEFALGARRAKYEQEVQALLDATLEAMRDGHDPTVGEILRQTGLSTSAFYRHFPGKDDLMVTLLDQAHELTAQHLHERLGSVRDPLRCIELWVRALFDLVRTPDALARNRALLLAHPRLLAQFPEEIGAGFAALAAPLAAAMADAAPVRDAALDARLALHQVFGILVDTAALGVPPSRTVIDGVVAYTRRAVLADDPPG